MNKKKICKYCTKEMLQQVEDYEYVYECECEAYLQEMELKKELRIREIELNEVIKKLRELEDNSELSKDIIKLNEKYGIGITY